MSEAVGAAFRDGETVGFSSFRFLTIRLESRNEGTAGLEGLPKPSDKVRFPIIETVQWTDVKDRLFLGDLIAVLVCNPYRFNEAKIIFSVIFIKINKHFSLQKCANAPTNKLYHKIIKKARKTLQNKGKIYLGSTSKWQTREVVGAELRKLYSWNGEDKLINN